MVTCRRLFLAIRAGVLLEPSSNNSPILLYSHLPCQEVAPFHLLVLGLLNRGTPIHTIEHGGGRWE